MGNNKKPTKISVGGSLGAVEAAARSLYPPTKFAENVLLSKFGARMGDVDRSLRRRRDP